MQGLGFWASSPHHPFIPPQGSSTSGVFGDKGNNKKKRAQTIGLGGSVSIAGGGVCGIRREEKYEAQISPTTIFPEATSVVQQQPLTPPQQVRASISCQFGCFANTVQYNFAFALLKALNSKHEPLLTTT